MLRQFTHLKNRLEPYLTHHSITGVVAQGHPLMRPMFLEFPTDKTTWFLDQQYMFGPDLLVAPVFGDSNVEYYVPSGTWTNVLTGKDVVGPAWVSEEHTMQTLPLLLRPGAVMVIGKKGHSVLDSIHDQGFSVVLSRHTDQKQTMTVQTRKGEIKVDIEPTANGVKVASKGDFEVVVLGERGLEKGIVAENGVATVSW